MEYEKHNSLLRVASAVALMFHDLLFSLDMSRTLEMAVKCLSNSWLLQ